MDGDIFTVFILDKEWDDLPSLLDCFEDAIDAAKEETAANRENVDEDEYVDLLDLLNCIKNKEDDNKDAIEDKDIANKYNNKDASQKMTQSTKRENDH